MIDEAKIIDVLKTIYDPEIPVNIYDLGLIYTINIDDQNYVNIGMTLTSPNCPVAESLPVEVRDKISALEGVEFVKVEILWEPPWNPDMMSEVAKLELGYL
ncbi:MAG: SUF system Fe-S cluster assembly protein [Calditrichaceae bacterium]